MLRQNVIFCKCILLKITDFSKSELLFLLCTSPNDLVVGGRLFAGPLAIIIFVNIIFFIRIMAVVLRIVPRQSSADFGSGKISLEQRMMQLKRTLRAALTFFTLMGITWVFGFLSLHDANNLTYQYIFAVLNAFSGVWLFLFHCGSDMKLRSVVAKYRDTLYKRAQWTVHLISGSSSSGTNISSVDGHSGTKGSVHTEYNRNMKASTRSARGPPVHWVSDSEEDALDHIAVPMVCVVYILGTCE